MKTPDEYCKLFYSNKILYLEDLIKQVQIDALQEMQENLNSSLAKLNEVQSINKVIQ